MDINKIKSYPLEDLLNDLGYCHTPSMNRHYYGMYLSPFREETSPSFKIDYNKNLWYDFGQGVGGDSISLVRILKKYGFNEAIEFISSLMRNDTLKKLDEKEEHSSNLEINNDKKHHSGIDILSVKNLYSYPLKNYISSRGISPELASLYVKELVYCTAGKQCFFSIGFPTNSGGYVLRNKNFKGNTDAAITTLAASSNVIATNQSSSTCRIYEGFFNFLSDMTLKHERLPQNDILILNSVNNVSRSQSYLLSHQVLECYLDNDTAGRKALDKIKTIVHGKGIEVRDMSFSYSEHNDLNELLLHKVSKQNISNNLKF